MEETDDFFHILSRKYEYQRDPKPDHGRHHQGPEQEFYETEDAVGDAGFVMFCVVSHLVIYYFNFNLVASSIGKLASVGT